MLGPRVQRLADTVDEFQLDSKSNQNSRGSPGPLEGSPPMSIVNGVCQSNRLASRCPPRLPSCAYRPYQSQRLRGNIDAIHRDVVRSGIRHIGELAGRMNGDRGGRRWLFKKPHDGDYRVPIPCRRRYTEHFVDLAKIVDRFHVATVHSEDESAL